MNAHDEKTIRTAAQMTAREAIDHLARLVRDLEYGTCVIRSERDGMAVNPQGTVTLQVMGQQVDDVQRVTVELQWVQDRGQDRPPRAPDLPPVCDMAWSCSRRTAPRGRPTCR